MNNKFVKYSKIENAYQEKYLEIIRNTVPAQEQWCVQEKIHGSNFSFWIDSDLNIRCAKRSGFINDGENFFGYQEVLEKYKDALTEHADRVFSRGSNITNITDIVIYGELYGNGVQSGVFYSNKKNFIAFDIGYKLAGIDRMVFVTLADVGIPSIETLFIGSLDECLAFSPSFNSRISEKEFANDNENLCEGVVIRPYYLDYYDSAGNRMILKHKNASFSEKRKNTNPKKKVEFTDEQQRVYERISEYITDARVNNVVSKMSYHEMSFGKILKDTIEDAFEDYEGDHGISPVNEFTDRDDWKVIGKQVQNDVTLVVRPVFLAKK